MRHALTAVLAVLTLAYPLAVYFGLQHTSARLFAVGLVVVFALRALVTGTGQPFAWVLAAVVAAFAAIVWWADSSAVLLYYPVLINACLLVVFALSLKFTPPVIERLARLTEPDLPPSGVRYTRGVTQVWCVFFAMNGAIAWITAAHGDLAMWTLYNGLIAYLLMAALFAIEYVVRQRFRRMHQDEPTPRL